VCGVMYGRAVGDYPTPSSEELNLAHRIYVERERRDLFYRAAIQLIALADTGQGDVSLSEALAVLLDVWNVQYYRRRPQQRRTLVNDLDMLLKRYGDQTARYRDRHIDSLEGEEREAITGLFQGFQEVLGPVGASKALHLLAPQFFPLWDHKIRRGYRVGSDAAGHAERYWRFMEITRRQVAACGGERILARNPVKALDEYNYCRFTLAAVELQAGE
jgi:hypothetical protein